MTGHEAGKVDFGASTQVRCGMLSGLDPSVNEVVALVLDVSPDSLNDDSRAGEIEQWDSMQQVILISVLETTYGVKFTTRDLDRMGSIGEMKAVIEAKLALR